MKTQLYQNPVTQIDEMELLHTGICSGKGGGDNPTFPADDPSHGGSSESD